MTKKYLHSIYHFATTDLFEMKIIKIKTKIFCALLPQAYKMHIKHLQGKNIHYILYTKVDKAFKTFDYLVILY